MPERVSVSFSVRWVRADHRGSDRCMPPSVIESITVFSDSVVSAASNAARSFGTITTIDSAPPPYGNSTAWNSSVHADGRYSS